MVLPNGQRKRLLTPMPAGVGTATGNNTPNQALTSKGAIRENKPNPERPLRLLWGSRKH